MTYSLDLRARVIEYVEQGGSKTKAATLFQVGRATIYRWISRMYLCLVKERKKIYGDKQGKRGKRENLVAGRRKGKKDLIAPMLFTGSLNAASFEGWLDLYLLPSLKRASVLIMDNAPIHRKTAIKLLVEAAGHQVLFLPKYSPDLNDIEHDFSALKRARMYTPADTSLDEIIRTYCAA